MGDQKRYSELPPIVELAERVRTSDATVQSLAKEYGVSASTMVNRFVNSGFSTSGETRRDVAKRELREYLSRVARTYTEPWMEEGICTQTDPEVFFPERGASAADAKRICGGCPVREKCLEYGLRVRDRYGVYGGLSERERRRLIKERAA